MLSLHVHAESWPLAQAFAIARGSRTAAQVVVARLTAHDASGWGECVPYARYGERIQEVVSLLESLAESIAQGLDPDGLRELLPAGAARNALDCALWDLEAHRREKPVHQLLGLPPPKPLVTAFTLSLDTPERMARAARQNAHRPLLKCKLDGQGDLERVAAVREGAPDSRLIVDANEAWSPEEVERLTESLARWRVDLIEQPLPAGQDEVLAGMSHSIPFCADESCHTRADLDRLLSRYQYINIKLDKTGGLTEALALAREARERGLGVMVGCMVSTSLAMAPAMLVAQQAEFVDLDGPLLIGRDRPAGLRYEGSLIHPASRRLWG